MWFGSDDSREEQDDSGFDREIDCDAPESTPDDDYWQVSRQPLAVLVFLLPLVLGYEFGAQYAEAIAAEPVRNGADYWIRTALAGYGLNQPWVLPALLLGGLLSWQIAGGYRWRVSAGTLLGMFCESVIFGMCLVFLGETQDLLLREFRPVPIDAPTATIPIPTASELSRALSYVGAGIYEEMLFRAALLPACFLVLRAYFSRRKAVVLAIVVTSLVFSGAHYIGPAGDRFQWFGFVFRAIAGGFFAVVMVLRGFGIAVGTHAAYDILVGLLLPSNLLQGWLDS